MAKSEHPPLNPLITLHQVLTDLLTYLLHSQERKPADPLAWEALTRLDETRKTLQSSLGSEPSEISDPHGRIPAPVKKEDK